MKLELQILDNPLLYTMSTLTFEGTRGAWTWQISMTL